MWQHNVVQAMKHRIILTYFAVCSCPSLFAFAIIIVIVGDTHPIICTWYPETRFCVVFQLKFNICRVRI